MMTADEYLIESGHLEVIKESVQEGLDDELLAEMIVDYVQGAINEAWVRDYGSSTKETD